MEGTRQVGTVSDHPDGVGVKTRCCVIVVGGWCPIAGAQFGGRPYVPGVGLPVWEVCVLPTTLWHPNRREPRLRPSRRDPAALGGLLSLRRPGALSADLSPLSLRETTPKAEAFSLGFWANCGEWKGSLTPIDWFRLTSEPEIAPFKRFTFGAVPSMYSACGLCMIPTS